MTETPTTPFVPLVTLTVIVCDLPLPCSTFGVAITAAQISGAGFGFGFGVGLGIGFTVGGVTGAVTTVGADAVLLPLSVSGVAVVTVTTFVFVPVSLTVALTVIETEAPAAMLPSAQERDDGCVVTTEHVPAVGVAETNVTPTGAASATLTSAAGSGPLFVTTRVYVIGAEPPPCGSCTATSRPSSP